MWAQTISRIQCVTLARWSRKPHPRQRLEQGLRDLNKHLPLLVAQHTSVLLSPFVAVFSAWNMAKIVSFSPLNKTLLGLRLCSSLFPSS